MSRGAAAGRRRRSIAIEVVLLSAICLFCIFPFYWMVTTSLKTQVVALQSPPAWLFTPTIENYIDVLFENRVGASLVNSIIVAVATTALAVGLGKKDLWFWFITNRFVSPVVLAFPVFLIAREIGLRDTHLALILMYLTFTLPIVIWICTDQFRAIPRDLDEAAMLEGASQVRVFWSICLPLAMPGVAVSSILSFIFSWNELLFAYILAPKNAKTAPAMAITFMEGYDVPYGKIMATSTLIVVPVLIFALIASRHLVRGLTMGAVK
jgi:multiple sugar transport system permease protein